MQGLSCYLPCRLAKLCAAHLLMVSMGWLSLHCFSQGAQQLVFGDRLAAQARHQLHRCQQGCQLSNSQCLQNRLFVCKDADIAYQIMVLAR